MSDARDTNRDGHVSLMEKVKDKLHLGHKDKDAEYTTHQTTTTTAHHTPIVGAVPVAGAMPLAGARDLNHDGHISTTEKLMSGSHNSAGFADPRDLNRDGYISTSEKLMSGGPHASAFTDSRDLNRDGHISTSERLAAGHTSGFPDSRDLNRDGHISTSERLAAGHTSGFTDSRDLNRDGHVSTSERLAAGAHGTDFDDDGSRLRLHEEQLAVAKREVGAGAVDIHKRVHEEHVQQTIPVRHEEILVERVPLHGVAEPGARIAAQDEVVRVPLFREEIITEKRLVPTEEVIVRKQEVMDQQTVGATLRSEYVDSSQTGMHQPGFDARDTNRDGHVSMGEKLMGGTNTGAFDARDTNRDGHVSMGEKLKGGHTAYGVDGRDLNRDGHVSVGEKMKTAPDMNGDGRVTMGEKIKAARG